MKTLEDLQDEFIWDDDELNIEILNNKICLLRVCSCRKNSTTKHIANPKCWQCKGTGIIITDAGKAIFKLVQAGNIIERHVEELGDDYEWEW